MSSIEKYELLKNEGSWIDRLKLIRSLADKTEMEGYLKKSSIASYEDLQMLGFLSKSMKNLINLMEIVKMEALPVCQRAEAAKAWLHLQHDPKQIHPFVVETITDSNIPRFLKHQILKRLHHVSCLKNSPSFFYELVCSLTESLHHEQFNIDAHLLPFCSSDQILNLLSRWSLVGYNQISCSSPLRSKLARYQPLISIHLIQGDLREKFMNYDELWKYSREHRQLFAFLARKEPKAMCQFALEYANRLENQKKILPHFVKSEQKRLFDKAPDEMIDLISSVASFQPGMIKYDSPWDYSGMELFTFDFPRSFSIDHYVRLFLVLYETCRWSVNHIASIVDYMLKTPRKYFLDRIIRERIGKEEFLDRLFKSASDEQLHTLRDFPELSIPFARHLLAQLDQTDVISAYQRATFLRYEYLTSDVFNEFVSLFQQCGSDVNERKWMYNLLLQCALSTDRQSVQRVLQWIEKRFVNEQLVVIESFLRNLASCSNRFHLDYLPENFESVQSIMNIAFNHLQRTSTTVEIILSYGLLLLNRSEKIQEFACRIIKQYYVTNVTFPCDFIVSPKARRLFATILVEDIFPKLISKQLIDEIQNLLTNCFHNAWRLSQIDTFLHAFFFEHISRSKKLQSEFNISEHSSLISLLLKSRSTRLERAYRLFSEIDRAFFLHADVQRALLRSNQYRQEIDQLLQGEKYLNLDRLSGDETNFHCQKIIPGFDLTVLKTCYYQLTGQQQEYVTNIILNDFLPDSEIANLDKLKALRVLRRLTHVHQKILQWIEQKPDSFLSASTDDSSNSKPTRGANIQTINHYIPSLPATFDLVSQDLSKQFDQLLARLNASNATYVGNALLCISQKIADRDFLQYYIEFIRSERFSKIGITAAKAILRLLVQYRFDSTLITSVFKPLWDSKPHPDVRACLMTVLINFIHDRNFTGEESVIWSILEEAAHDDYDPVVSALCNADAKGIRRPSRRLRASPNNLRIFVQRIQMKMLDHPTSLTRRIWAWSLLDPEYSDIDLVRNKARQLCIEFDKNANVLWKEAFQRMLFFYKQKKISANDLVDFIQSIMNQRSEVDVSLDALDYQNDLPIYHRINNLLELFITSLNEVDLQARLCFRSFAVSLVEFEITMASLSGKLLMKLAQTKEDLEEILTVFQQRLHPVYFEHVTIELASVLAANDGSCCFVQQLSVDEKFQLALCFVNEKGRPLFVFDLLKNDIFNKASVDKQQCQLLLRQMRQSENLLLRQRALQYRVLWRKDGTINAENNQ